MSGDFLHSQNKSSTQPYNEIVKAVLLPFLPDLKRQEEKVLPKGAQLL